MEHTFSEWSDWRLEQRLEDLEATSEIAHNSERRQQIARETTHLLFEISYRADRGEVVMPKPKAQNTKPKKGGKR